MTKPEEKKAPDPKDLSATDVPAIFEAKQAFPTIQKQHGAVVAKARAAVNWYAIRKGRKKCLTLLLRLGALGLGTAATVVPMASYWLGTQHAGVLAIAPMCAAVAGALLLLEKFLGLSTGWIRYTGAMLELQSRLEAFSSDWNRAMILQPLGEQSAPEVLVGAMDRLAAFARDVDAIVRAETQAWAVEFRGSLAEFDGQIATLRANAQLASGSALGSIRVQLTNREKLTGPTTVTVEGRTPVTSSDAQVVFTNLGSGQYKVSAAGVLDGKPTSAQDVATVKAGEVANTALELRPI